MTSSRPHDGSLSTGNGSGWSGITPSENMTPTPTPGNVVGATPSGGHTFAGGGNGGPGGHGNNFVTICSNGQTLTVSQSVAQSYLSGGATMGPCSGGATAGPGPNVNPGPGIVGNNGPGGGGCSAGPSCTGGPVCGGGCSGGGVGIIGNGGSNCPTGGFGTGTYFTGGVIAGGTNISSGCYIGRNWGRTYNWRGYCNTYYGYGYDYYYAAPRRSGFCFAGLFGGVSFQIVYPFLDPGCNVVNIIPRRNRRVVILESVCGSFHWRIVERRTWVPARYVWFDGCRQWVDGYWTWRVSQRDRIYDYWDCESCYY